MISVKWPPSKEVSDSWMIPCIFHIREGGFSQACGACLANYEINMRASPECKAYVASEPRRFAASMKRKRAVKQNSSS
jgi:hypothetical protein